MCRPSTLATPSARRDSRNHSDADTVIERRHTRVRRKHNNPRLLPMPSARLRCTLRDVQQPELRAEGQEIGLPPIPQDTPIRLYAFDANQLPAFRLPVLRVIRIGVN
jgi:hypothetical protein